MTDEAQQDEVTFNDPPCKIRLIREATFIVDRVRAWGYVPQGVVARGHWKGYDGNDTHVIINAEQIEHIEIDYDALKRFNDQRAEAVEDSPKLILLDD